MNWRGLAFASVLAAPGVAFSQTLTIVGADGAAKTLAAADLAGLPRAEVTVTTPDVKVVYEGPVLSYVLRAGGLPVGSRLHGDPLRDYLVVSGQDGFSAVYSLAEMDKDFHDDVVILADKADGKSLPTKQAPWRVVSSGDRKAWRSVYAVTRIEAHQVAAIKPGP